MSTQICVAVVVEKDNKILLAQEAKDKPYEKSKNLWTIPAGKVELQENLIQSAIREVKEETGLNIKLNGLIGIYEMSSVRGQSLGVAFKARIIKKVGNKTPELKNIKWVDVKEITKSNIKFRKGIKEVIEDYLEGEFLPINRVRDVLDTDI